MKQASMTLKKHGKKLMNFYITSKKAKRKHHVECKRIIND